MGKILLRMSEMVFLYAGCASLFCFIKEDASSKFFVFLGLTTFQLIARVILGKYISPDVSIDLSH